MMLINADYEEPNYIWLIVTWKIVAPKKHGYFLGDRKEV